MSKSLGNIVNPYDVFDAVGADALRWHFTARVAPDVQKRVSVEIIADVASSFINTLWNTYAFFVMYARLDGVDRERGRRRTRERPEIDRWILSLLEETIATTTAALDDYDALRAGAAIERFVDQLSNWYVRRNRRRFWKAASGADKQAAYLTLYECLEVVEPPAGAVRAVHHARPCIRTSCVRSRREAPVSVHMAAWPAATPARLDRTLLAETDVVQRVVGLGRAARNSSKLKVRQPLSRLLVRVPDDAAAEAAVRRHEDQILEELNVKKLELIARDATLVSYRIKPNLPVIGKRYGKLIPAIREYLATADGAAIAAAVARGETQTFAIDGQALDDRACRLARRERVGRRVRVRGGGRLSRRPRHDARRRAAPRGAGARARARRAGRAQASGPRGLRPHRAARRRRRRGRGRARANTATT